MDTEILRTESLGGELEGGGGARDRAGLLFHVEPSVRCLRLHLPHNMVRSEGVTDSLVRGREDHRASKSACYGIKRYIVPTADSGWVQHETRPATHMGK